MSDQNGDEREERPRQMPLPGQMYVPTKKDRLHPRELLGFSAVLALFVGIIVLMATREWLLSGMFFLAAFVATLIVMLLFSLTFKSKSEDAPDPHKYDRDDTAH